MGNQYSRCLQLIPMDPMQMATTIAINNHVGLVIVDSRAYKTAMETQVMQQYKLTMDKVLARNCEKFGIPGSVMEYDYA